VNVPPKNSQGNTGLGTGNITGEDWAADHNDPFPNKILKLELKNSACGKGFLWVKRTRPSPLRSRSREKLQPLGAKERHGYKPKKTPKERLDQKRAWKRKGKRRRKGFGLTIRNLPSK